MTTDRDRLAADLHDANRVVLRDDSDDTVSVEGRVRCLVAVVEAYREDTDADV